MYWRRKKKQDGEGNNEKRESMFESLKPNQDRKQTEEFTGVFHNENSGSTNPTHVSRYGNTLDSSPISNSKTINSQETIVPNSTELVIVDHDQTKLEISRRVDLRVCDSQDSGTEIFLDAYTRLINCCGEEQPKFDVMQLSELHIGDDDRKVRYLDDLMQRETTTTKQPASKEHIDEVTRKLDELDVQKAIDGILDKEAARYFTSELLRLTRLKESIWRQKSRVFSLRKETKTRDSFIAQQN
ncbi:hypothetical protein V6N12_066959 [Hibiscus sabdariffa]|uniref:Uncharacterized protein n=1 Tax=Hibiscus sabdariffa TaxID=183260 RepID=A0ABR2AU10_9ROSI